jgi:mRNA-degrading endonuclease RelE of RelBE toxin-antitoxin system
MEFRIAETFTDSLCKLTAQEQKAVKTTAFDLQINPANPGIRFHKLDKAKDPNFWSATVSMDIRIIVHRTEQSILLCYVDHHDNAYIWAERRKLETHPKTGAAQIVEIRETVKEVTVPVYVESEQPVEKPLIFAHLSEDELLAYGVPSDWMKDVKQATEDSLLELAGHLPSEASEALLDLATGVIPQVHAMPEGGDPFTHPDAQRRFRLMTDVEELERALDYPWEKWTVFLHPAQRKLVERDYSGPARVSGSAGTGKTIVALHRAAHLARTNMDARVLLTTFSDPLAYSLQNMLSRLLGKEPRLGERLEVESMYAVGMRLYRVNLGRLTIAPKEEVEQILEDASAQVHDHKFSSYFLRTEWGEVVDSWQLDTWEKYRDVVRLGRKTRLPEPQRKVLWEMFEIVRTRLNDKGMKTHSQMFSELAVHLKGNTKPPFDYTIVDEAQDISIAQIKFLAALSSRPDSLFFSGDLGQRIFQQPFSWKSLGVDIRGRSFMLRINYRTSHQIRQQADKLLAPELADVDGIVEERRATQSVFNGPKPTIEVKDSQEEEKIVVANWLKELLKDGYKPDEIGVFVRSDNEIPRAQKAVQEVCAPFVILDEKLLPSPGRISICSMHLAKGLEFRAVAVMACDDEIIPLQDRIDRVVDDSDLEEVYNTERHLLYVACTRARDRLLVTSVNPGSEFIDDLNL